MNMQEPFSELMRVGRIEGAERRLRNHLRNSGEEGRSIKEELSPRTERSTASDTGSRTVATMGKVTVDFEEEDDELMIEMEKAPTDRLPAQTLGATRYCSRWMRRKPSSTIASQTSLTWEDPEVLSVKMEAMKLEAIVKAQEKKLKADILTGTIRQKRLKEQLEECSKNRCQASATVTSVEAGTSCQGHTASRRTEDKDDANTDDWQAELLHDMDEDTFPKLDTMAADLDEMATRERWLFCRSCKAWHTVPCSKTSSFSC
jgi:chromatin segregation and condensation protein Rec8/ScpA/Scc1 (kleisin family)